MRSTRSHEIWVAEDNDDVRLLLGRAFRRTIGMAHLVFFENGASLVDHAATHRTSPQLLLLDLQMPVMDGLETLHELRRNQTFAETPVVIFSSNEDADTVRAAYLAGATLYLKKPHRWEEFSDVARLCGSSSEALAGLRKTGLLCEALDVQEAVKKLSTVGSGSALQEWP